MAIIFILVLQILSASPHLTHWQTHRYRDIKYETLEYTKSFGCLLHMRISFSHYSLSLHFVACMEILFGQCSDWHLMKISTRLGANAKIVLPSRPNGSITPCSSYRFIMYRSPLTMAERRRAHSVVQTYNKKELSGPCHMYNVLEHGDT